MRNLPVINLDESEIEDGDYMAIRRTDGVGTMVQDMSQFTQLDSNIQ